MAQWLALKIWFCHTHFPETALSKLTNYFHNITKSSGLVASDSISAFAILNPNSLLRAIVSLSALTLDPHFMFRAGNTLIVACMPDRAGDGTVNMEGMVLDCRKRNHMHQYRQVHAKISGVISV